MTTKVCSVQFDFISATMAFNISCYRDVSMIIIDEKKCTGKALEMLDIWDDAKLALHEAKADLIEAQGAYEDADRACAIAYRKFYEEHNTEESKD